MLLEDNLLPPPRPWQSDALSHTASKLLIHADPRVGKTNYAALWAREVAVDPRVRTILVSAPLAVCPYWFETMHKAGFTVHPYYQGSATDALRHLKRGLPEGVVIINTDRLDALRPALQGRVQAYICDEVHQAKGPSSRRGRAARAIAKAALYFRALTGTPVPNHVGELWSSLTMAGAYEGSWTAFQGDFVIRDPMFPSRILGPRLDAMPRLERMLLDNSVTVPRESVFGPDQFNYVVRHVHLPPAAVAAYKRMAKEWVNEQANVTANNALSRMTRLQQITSGFLPDKNVYDEPDDEATGYTVLHTAKIAACMADLDEPFNSGEKAVVFHRFRWEGEAMRQAMGRVYRGKVPTYTIDGDRRKATTNEDARAAFQAEREAAVIIVQIQSGGTGISLSTAQHAMFLSRTFSFVEDTQARDRILEPGQPRTITRYLVPGTIDISLDAALRKKQKIHETVRGANIYGLVFGEAA